jgi:ABC-type antimicrobial peptide transport system permease subunit
VRGGRDGRRRLLAALGVAAAALVVGVCATLAFALATGFERAADDADLPDVIVRFDPARRAAVDERIAALPNLAARAYRFEVTDVPLRSAGGRSRHGAVEVVRGRRGYAVVDGRDVRGAGRAREVVVEQGVAREWYLGLGSTLHVGRLGPLRVVGIARSPDNVAFPLAAAARVYIAAGLVDRGRPLPVDTALLWLHDRSRTDVTLTQARAQAYGISGLSFLTRSGLRSLIAQAAGIVIALLIAFSVVALAAAAVMLATAAHADVQRRLPSTAIRRALGFSRAAVTRDTTLAALRFAVPAALLGLAAGWALALAPTNALLGLLNEAPPGPAVLPLLAGCLVAIVGLVAATSAWPAWRATAASPAALLRGGELTGRSGRAVRRTRGLRRPGGLVALGARLVWARRARFAGTVAVIAMCASVVLLMLALATLLERLRDDPATLGKRYALTLDASPAQVPAVERVEGVAAAAPRWTFAAADSFSLGESLRVVAFAGDHTRFEAPPLIEGRRLRRAGEAEVGRGLADQLGLAPGSTLAVALPGGAGEARFRVVGVVGALDNEGRVAYVRPPRIAAALEGRPPQIAVRLAPGASRDAVQARLRAAGFHPTTVVGATGNSQRLLSVLSAVLRVVAATVGLVTLYALVQALALTAADRRRTLGLLRTLGAGPAALALVLAGAGAALVVPAALLAIALELLVLGPFTGHLAADYADLGVQASAGQALLVVLGLLLLAGAAAGWVAWRLGRAPLAAVLREPA